MVFQENPETAFQWRLQAKRRCEGQPELIYESTLPRKFSKIINVKSVPQTDTGDQVE
jgi:hypothetical protein